MNYITITTPENIDIRYRLSGAGSRLAAAVLDLFFQAVLFFVILISVVYVYAFASDSAETFISEDFTMGLFAVLSLSYFVICYLYYVVFETIWRGQTPGKRIMGLRAVRENGRPIGLVQSMSRTAIKFFVDYYGVGLILILFSKKCKRLGDMAASTIVVAENPEAVTLDELRAGRPAGDTAPKSGNLRLGDEEYYLLADYYIREGQWDYGASGEALEAIRRHLAWRFGVDADKLTDGVIRRVYEINAR